MIQKLRERMGKSEGGFTLVELLVVMLILGLLAAIAIPSFFNQRDKAKDADAKSAARTAQTAMETYATDNQGSYSAVSFAKLEGLESTLNDAPNAATATATADAAGKGYTITVASDTGINYTISRAGVDDAGPPVVKAGQTSLTCDDPGNAGCPSNGHWG